MTSAKRLGKELADVQAQSNNKDYFFRKVTNPGDNINTWEGLLVCDREPYHPNKGIKVQIDFPNDYPFKPPKIKFLSLIYHPNVDEKGQVCLPLILPDNWKPAIKAIRVIEELKRLVENPEPDHALRTDVGEEYLNSKSKFMKTAKETFEKNGAAV